MNSTLDQDQINFERGKSLPVLDIRPYIADVQTVNSMVTEDFDNTVLNYYAFEDDQQELRRNDAEILAQKLKEEEEDNRIESIEKLIFGGIRKFTERNPHHKEAIETIGCKVGYAVGWVDVVLPYSYKVQKDCYADLVANIGNHFKNSSYDDADYFYDLSRRGFSDYTMNGSQSSQGYMHLDLYNGEISKTKPQQPTASLYYHLTRAITALSAASITDEVAEFSFSYLVRIRDMIVRWHLSLQSLSDTSSYSRMLTKTVYAHGFVDWILNQAKIFKQKFCFAKRYDGSKTNADLAKHLIDFGFCGVYQQHNQHNWVHPNGFMVRVKINRYDHHAEYTIGLTAENPIVWSTDRKPTPRNLVQLWDDSYLVFDKTNEVLKLACDWISKHKTVYLVPAFRAQKKHWFDSNVTQVNPMMQMAHFPLQQGFGRQVERVLDHQGQHLVVQFQVKWRQFEGTGSPVTWIPWVKARWLVAIKDYVRKIKLLHYLLRQFPANAINGAEKLLTF